MAKTGAEMRFFRLRRQNPADHAGENRIFPLQGQGRCVKMVAKATDEEGSRAIHHQDHE